MCVQGDRGSRRRLEDEAPSDAELGGEEVGAGGKDDVADGGVGECTGQAGDGAHRGLKLTAVAGHKLHGVRPGSVIVAGLGGSGGGGLMCCAVLSHRAAQQEEEQQDPKSGQHDPTCKKAKSAVRLSPCLAR